METVIPHLGGMIEVQEGVASDFLDFHLSRV